MIVAQKLHTSLLSMTKKIKTYIVKTFKLYSVPFFVESAIYSDWKWKTSPLNHKKVEMLVV